SHAVVSLLIAFTMLARAALDMMGELRVETDTDPLSGLLNRRGFERGGGGALSRRAKHKLPASLVIADLDHFKAVNDRFGHAVGDKVIVAFAELLRGAANRGAVVGRLGGEGVGGLVREGVRMSFSNASLRDVPDRVKVTASFGVASLSGNESLSELLGRAD